MDQTDLPLHKVSDWQLGANQERTMLMLRIGPDRHPSGVFPPARVYQWTSDQARKLASDIGRVLG